ncbi:hypothetical protein CK203_103327 [Vitis vinifera]|uniref:Uncharacterized protein n=1 Tax=Vitis vinifera TaxID=29760 RepID=A0A438FBX0_VITVI|nr:hypothetical protein CK203_103327 [Vitis vinifera]
MSFFFHEREIERWWEWEDCWPAISSHARAAGGGEVAAAQGRWRGYGERGKERKEKGEEEEKKKKWRRRKERGSKDASFINMAAGANEDASHRVEPDEKAPLLPI